MQIVVTTTIQTLFEVPDGVPIERIQSLALETLSDGDEQLDEVMCLHSKSITLAFCGEEEICGQSVQHKVNEAA